MSKSLVSKVGGMEFAKRVWYNGEIFSAIPPRDAFLAFRHPVMLPNFIRGLARDVDRLPASHSIRFLIEHFGVAFKPYRSILQLPKALLGSLVELLGIQSLYADEYTPFLLLSLQRSRVRDVIAWFQGKAHFTAPDVLSFRLLDDGYYAAFKRENGAPFSWARSFKRTVNDSGIRISHLESVILIFWGLLIEIPDVFRYWLEYREAKALSDSPEGITTIMNRSSTAGPRAGNISDSFDVDTTFLMGRKFKVPLHGFGRELWYYVYTLDPLKRSPLNKVSMDWTSTDAEVELKLRDAYKGARAKARLIRSLGRPYLQLPAA
jgi:hypothetical protein